MPGLMRRISNLFSSTPTLTPAQQQLVTELGLVLDNTYPGIPAWVTTRGDHILAVGFYSKDPELASVDCAWVEDPRGTEAWSTAYSVPDGYLDTIPTADWTRESRDASRLQRNPDPDTTTDDALFDRLSPYIDRMLDAGISSVAAYGSAVSAEIVAGDSGQLGTIIKRVIPELERLHAESLRYYLAWREDEMSRLTPAGRA